MQCSHLVFFGRSFCSAIQSELVVFKDFLPVDIFSILGGLGDNPSTLIFGRNPDIDSWVLVSGGMSWKEMEGKADLFWGVSIFGFALMVATMLWMSLQTTSVTQGPLQGNFGGHLWEFWNWVSMGLIIFFPWRRQKITEDALMGTVLQSMDPSGSVHEPSLRVSILDGMSSTLGKSTTLVQSSL